MRYAHFSPLIAPCAMGYAHFSPLLAPCAMRYAHFSPLIAPCAILTIHFLVHYSGQFCLPKNIVYQNDLQMITLCRYFLIN
jgi:hypothetical protein